MIIKDFDKEELILKKLNSLYQANIGKAISYLAQRKISAEEVKFYGLGYSKGLNFSSFKGEIKDKLVKCSILFEKDEKLLDGMCYRLTIPIYDEYSRLIGFQGRSLSNKSDYSKYKTSTVREYSGVLYGLYHVLPKYYRGEVFVTEGWFDYLTLRRITDNVVCSFSAKVSQRQVKLMKRYFSKVILAFDNDIPAREAYEKLEISFRREGLGVKILDLPKILNYKDWAEIYEKDGLGKVKEVFGDLCRKNRIVLQNL